MNNISQKFERYRQLNVKLHSESFKKPLQNNKDAMPGRIFNTLVCLLAVLC